MPLAKVRLKGALPCCLSEKGYRPLGMRYLERNDVRFGHSFEFQVWMNIQPDDLLLEIVDFCSIDDRVRNMRVNQKWRKWSEHSIRKFLLQPPSLIVMQRELRDGDIFSTWELKRRRIYFDRVAKCYLAKVTRRWNTIEADEKMDQLSAPRSFAVIFDIMSTNDFGNAALLRIRLPLSVFDLPLPRGFLVWCLDEQPTGVPVDMPFEHDGLTWTLLRNIDVGLVYLDWYKTDASKMPLLWPKCTRKTLRRIVFPQVNNT